MDPETRAVYAKKTFIHRIWFKCLAFCISSFGVYAFLFSGFNVESEAREIKEDPRKIFENFILLFWLSFFIKNFHLNHSPRVRRARTSGSLPIRHKMVENDHFYGFWS